MVCTRPTGMQERVIDENVKQTEEPENCFNRLPWLELLGSQNHAFKQLSAANKRLDCLLQLHLQFLLYTLLAPPSHESSAPRGSSLLTIASCDWLGTAANKHKGMSSNPFTPSSREHQEVRAQLHTGKTTLKARTFVTWR